ncbi:PQQ-binding-like beta-propeller repeat protein [Paludisphaera sp.]|uniref:outer membrane protein assembly factor BamB family protein n=1 Tax=Paludisphaera sp. TaxID=2017432 RepID=UPI00301B967E
MRIWLGIALPLALACLASFPVARGQDARPTDPDKVSNDDPARPFQMPPATTEVKEALEDFDRFRERGAWERAFKALYSINEDQARRFVDGADGFIIPVARKRREVLSALPPEGQSAYRLFHDAEAQKLFDQAQGDAEKANLERLFSAYFTTTVGAKAADRLGDLYFQEGRFDRAADCWLAVLKRNDVDLPPAPLAVKAAVALARAGRRAEFAELREEIEDRHRDESVDVAGRTESAPEALRRILEAGRSPESPAVAAAAPDAGPIAPAEGVAPAWRFLIAETIEAGMGTIELNQWRAGALSSAAPAASVDGGRLYLNFLGRILALDLETGKLLWRTGSFHDLRRFASQPMGQMLDPERYAILARGKRLWTVSRDPKDQNYSAAYQLECRNAEDGEVLWKLAELPDLAGYEPTGPPLLADDALFVPAKSQQGQPLPQQWVLALRPEDGRLLWKSEVAVSRQAEQHVYYSNRRESKAQVRLLLRAGSLYVDTHAGILARLDADSGALEWGYGYETAPLETERYFSYGNQQQEPQAAGEAPVDRDGALIFKGAKSSRVYAIDPDRMAVSWRRPIGKAARIAAVEGRTIYLGGEELSALDAETRELRWAVRLPGGSYRGNVIARPDGVWQATPRGVFELDPADGTVRRIFRGDDLGVDSADLITTPDRVLIVSNRAITAYPRRPDDAPANPKENAPR